VSRPTRRFSACREFGAEFGFAFFEARRICGHAWLVSVQR
jgi:hypothetical protein